MSYARYYLQARPTYPQVNALAEWLMWLTCFVPWSALALAIFRLERRYPISDRKWLTNLLKLAVISLPFCYVAVEIAFGLSLIIDFFFHRQLDPTVSWWKPQLAEFWVMIMIYWSVVAAAYMIRSLIQLHEREQEAAQLALEKSMLESSLHQAELETLRTRLNPHFLFNCLQNISVLTNEDPKTASQMLVRLGDLLRTALRNDSGPETTLTTEIALTQSYVAVEKMRFDDRLTVLFDIAPKTERALVPTFLLQPLVENAIVHGLQGVHRVGIISVRSTIQDNDLLLAVTDNGIGLPVKDASELEVGVGLNSTIERLRRMYPNQHSFSMRPLPEGGTEVLVVLPLHFESLHLESTAHEQTSLVDRR
jgi:signal transduction histidine kinase